MRYPAFTFALMTTSLLAGAAFAGDTQDLHYPDVVKLPAPPGEQVLLYPGGRYGRILPYGLKQPGADVAPIHLHKPAAHPHTTIAKTRPAPQHTYAAPAEVKTATAGPHHKITAPVKHVAKQAVKPVTHSASAATLKTEPKPVIKPAAKPATHIAKASPPPRPATKPKPVYKTAPKPVAKHHKPPQKPVHVAKAEPAPRHTHTPFYARQSNAERRMAQIRFQRSASQPSGQEIRRINALAGALNDAVSGRNRVQILAYAGPKGSKTSSARRLSLKRALIVRQLLIDDGVPSDRIDVRAMGGITDNGAPERVDVFLKN